jgi:hypothetical protein
MKADEIDFELSRLPYGVYKVCNTLINFDSSLYKDRQLRKHTGKAD